MKRLLILIALVVLLPAAAFAQNDPCAMPKMTVVVNISTATTTELVAATSIGGNGRRIILCGYDFTITGTTPTYLFELGTKASTACDTGATAISGTYAPTSGNKVSFGGANQTVVNTKPGTELCLVSGGTNPSIQGVVEFVVAP